MQTTERPILKSAEQSTWRPFTTITPTTPTPTTTTTTTRATSTTVSRPIETTSAPQTSTKTTTTTGAPVVITAKPIVTSRPRITTTTQAPLGFGANILKALFGANPFGPSTTQRPAPITQRPSPTTQKPVSTTKKFIPTTLATSAPEKLREVHVTPRQVETSKIQSNTPNSLSLDPKPSTLPKTPTAAFTNEDDARFLAALLQAVDQTTTPKSRPKAAPKPHDLSQDDEAFLRAILNGQASVKPSMPSSHSAASDAAFLAALLKAQGIEPSTPANRLVEQLQLGQLASSSGKTTPTNPPRTVPSTAARKPSPIRTNVVQTTWSPSSTYPPSLFSNFANLGSASQGSRGQSNTEEADGSVRSQVFNAAIGATRAFSQFLGAAITVRFFNRFSKLYTLFFSPSIF